MRTQEGGVDIESFIMFLLLLKHPHIYPVQSDLFLLYEVEAVGASVLQHGRHAGQEVQAE